MEENSSRSCSLFSADVEGLEAPLLEVEVHASHGLPRVDIVGLAEPCVRESKQRVRAAIVASGWRFPEEKITVNLAPASVKKMGTGSDLAVALGILWACGKVEIDDANRVKTQLMIGELSLSGNLRPVHGMLNIALMARTKGFKTLILPVANLEEARLVSGLDFIAAHNLLEVARHLEGSAPLPVSGPSQNASPALTQSESIWAAMDLKQIRGQNLAKQALLVAAAGGHNLLFVGPPGSGKTLLAHCMPHLLPDLSEVESIETTRIYSCAGLLNGAQRMLIRPPLRSPHHTVTDAGLMGGAKNLLPGELSLAHNGLLFLDEFSEFRRDVLEILREPLESGLVTLSRAKGSVNYPARFQLIAAMNPCPCGFAGVGDGNCHCPSQMIQKYMRRISGPLLDRIDLRIFLHPVPYSEFFDKVSSRTPQMTTQEARAWVEKVRQRQRERYRNEKFTRNADIPAEHIERYCPLTPRAKKELIQSLKPRHVTGRSIHRLLRVTRTLADLALEKGQETKEEITQEAILEGLNLWQIPKVFF